MTTDKQTPPLTADTLRATALAKLREKYTTAIDKVVNEFDDKALLASITADLQQQKRAVVWRVLGLNDTWGKWEIDRTNGRDSILTQYLSAQIKEQLQAVIADAVREEVEAWKKKLPDKVKKAFSAAVADAMSDYSFRRNYIDHYVADLMKDVAEEAAAELNKELRDANPSA